MGTRAVYQCNQGFQLQRGEQPSAECLRDGQWSNGNQPPQCTGESLLPGILGIPSVVASSSGTDSFASPVQFLGHQVYNGVCIYIYSVY